MIRARTVQQNFSRAAARYDAHATLQKGWRTRVLANGLALFPERAALLDIGCGTGAFTMEAREVQPHWTITGLDSAPGMCRVAAQHGTVIQADATCMPMPDVSYDGIVSSLCLQWVSNLDAAFAEMVRVLKPGGYAVLMTLGMQTLHELRTLAPALRLLPMRDAQTYHSIATQAGFEPVALDAPVEHYEYPSLSGLLRSFRQIGAHAAFDAPPARLSPSQYHTIAASYHASHAHGAGVLASWQPVLLILRKPS